MPSVVMYLLIVFVKTIELSMTTVRLKLITKGQKLAGSVIGFFEVALWLIVVSIVLDDITSDPWKVVAYSLGFALGNYVGSVLEEKIGLGNARIDVIVPETEGLALAEELREKNFAVTVIDGKGRIRPRKILIVIVKRKDIPEVSQFIMDHTDEAFITMSDTTPVIGGYRLRR
ncbi:MAG TPA: DUF2179 domain-containing protein [Tissierellia bacterium]|nr:DUF2179 domain-containing protein [Tissierellia bacterium]